MSDEELNFLEDFIVLLREDAFKAREDLNRKNKDLFYNGRLIAYREVFKTIKNQLISFNIDPKKVKFDLDPDRDLLPE